MTDFSNTETNLINSKLQSDMEYGQRVMIVTTPDADIKNDIDYTIGALNIAYRRRRFKMSKYGEISIRNSRTSGAKTERQKILDGECKSSLFIFEFLDGWVICNIATILHCLKTGQGYVKSNNDGITSAYYIPIKNISCLIICKEGAGMGG